MDKFMDRPWFLRFTALVLALALFFSVQAKEKESIRSVGDAVDVIQDVPVEVYYDNENLVVTGVPETVNMTISGPANIVQSTKLLKDFAVIVDLRNLPMGQHNVPIKTENISEKLHVKLDPASVDVVIEEKITQTFQVDPEFNDRLLAENYELDKIEVEPSAIEVTGAKSVIEAIQFVKVSVTGEKNIDRSFEQKARVRVLDRELNKLNVSMNPEEVTVKVDVVELQKEIPIVVKSVGRLSDDLTLESLTTETDTVKVYGPRSILDEINELPVEVDLSTIQDSKTIDIDLKKPKGITKLSQNKVKINVQVKKKKANEESNTDNDEGETATASSEEVNVGDDTQKESDKQQEGTKQFANIPIEVRGLDKRYQSSFKNPTEGLVDVTVTAKKEMLDKLTKSDLNVFVDASQATTEGDHALPIVVEMPVNFTWKLSTDEATLELELA